MDSTNKMLDSFHAMNVVIQKDVNASDGETSLLKYTAEERAHLCARISHLFQGGPSASGSSMTDTELTKRSARKLIEA